MRAPTRRGRAKTSLFGHVTSGAAPRLACPTSYGVTRIVWTQPLRRGLHDDVQLRLRHSLRRLAAPLFALPLVLGACGREASDGIAPDPAASSAPPAAPARNAGARGARAAATAETWNAAQIEWQPYEAGLARAKAQNKPVCLVLYTNWCPHCRNYSHVFDDAKVVEEARKFVMIKVNADEESAIAKQYQRDGSYIPRTFFLAPDGTLDPDIHAPRPKFMYFYDEKNAGPLLAGMAEALKKLVK